MTPGKEGPPVSRLTKAQLVGIQKRDILNSCHLPPIQDPILDSIIFMVLGERQDRHLLLREVRALEQALERDEMRRVLLEELAKNCSKQWNPPSEKVLIELQERESQILGALLPGRDSNE